MRIVCPHCGERGLEEFLFHGDATVRRPVDGGPAATAEWTDYVYLRDNPYGISSGLWYHASGCHAWLVVERSVISHRIVSVQLARDVVR